MRENQRVYVLGIGADAVTNAILGIGNARLFLENDRLDIKVGCEQHPVVSIQLNSNFSKDHRSDAI